MSIFRQEDFRKQIFERVFSLIFLLGLRQFVMLSLRWLGIELGLKLENTPQSSFFGIARF